jgi:hypothetical protein
VLKEGRKWEGKLGVRRRGEKLLRGEGAGGGEKKMMMMAVALAKIAMMMLLLLLLLMIMLMGIIRTAQATTRQSGYYT